LRARALASLLFLAASFLFLRSLAFYSLIFLLAALLFSLAVRANAVWAHELDFF